MEIGLVHEAISAERFEAALEALFLALKGRLGAVDTRLDRVRVSTLGPEVLLELGELLLLLLLEALGGLNVLVELLADLVGLEGVEVEELQDGELLLDGQGEVAAVLEDVDQMGEAELCRDLGRESSKIVHWAPKTSTRTTSYSRATKGQREFEENERRG